MTIAYHAFQVARSAHTSQVLDFVSYFRDSFIAFSLRFGEYVVNFSSWFTAINAFPCIKVEPF